MSGIMSMVLGAKTAIAAAVDAYFNLVTLLLPGDGTNGAQNNTFLDSSSNNFTITRNGGNPGMMQGTFSPFSQTGWSNYFDGSSTYLSIATSSTALAFGTGDFTIEGFFFFTSTPQTASNPSIVGSQNGGFIGWRPTTTGIEVYTPGVGNAVASDAFTIPTNQWVHMAVVREGTSMSFYMNGSRQGAAKTNTNNYAAPTSDVSIARTGTGGPVVAGYISSLRIVKGRAVYSGSTYTVPTAALGTTSGGANPPQGTETSLLTCQSNRFIDNSSNAFTLVANNSPSIQAFSPFAPTAAYSASTNGGSGYFDGTGDFLNFTGSSATNFNGTDWTIETWVYLNGAPTDYLNIIQSTTGANNWIPYLSVGFRSTYELNIALNAANNQSTQKAVPYAWNHIAVVRSGGVVKVYLNGAATSISVTVDINNSNLSFYFGKADNTPGGGSAFAFLNGYMCGTRFTKTAVYTAAFTPPTSPPTAITNTQLLLNFTNAGITDATAKNDLETVGGAQISTTQSKFGGSSMYFDGTDDRLVLPSSENLVLGTGNFTIEGWFYANNVSNKGVLQLSGTAGGLQAGETNTIAFALQTGNYTLYAANAANGMTGTPPTSTWTHFAIVRSSGVTRLYINGTQAGSNITDTTNYTGKNLCIGGYYDTGYLYNGYIDDFRITKGYARYTANFTAPTAAFPLS